MSFDVVTFGETMIRLSPPNRERIESTDSLDLRVGGSESNTACALARLGRSVSWFSKLPDNPLGRRIEQSVRRWGVDTSHVIWTDSGRAGVYFIEFGAPPRAHAITYDRAGSVASLLAPHDIDWDVLSETRHLHVTGITCALSESCAATVRRAISEAKSRGLTVSFDVNYRARLWSAELARQVIEPMFELVDLLFCTTADARTVFGMDISPQRISAAFPAATTVVTAGELGAWAGDCHVSAIPSVEVDRVGGGDAFDAGVIDGFLDGDLERGLRQGVAMAALKYTLPGDELVATRAEIEAVMAGAESRIQR